MPSAAPALDPCPSCGGRGYVSYWYDGRAAGWQRGAPLAGCYRTETEPCPDCRGEGVAEREVAA